MAQLQPVTRDPKLTLRCPTCNLCWSVAEKKVNWNEHKGRVCCPRCKKRLIIRSPESISPNKKRKVAAMGNPKQIGHIIIEPYIFQNKSISIEQYGKLGNVLNVHYLANDLRSVLVTSLAPGEGKTTVSLNLSVALVQGLAESAILVDADLRKKSLTSILGLGKRLGLSDLVSENVSIEEVMLQTETQGLTLVPAGSDLANAARAVSSSRMRRLLQELNRTHEKSYIVIDSPPFLPTSEVNALSQMVDGIILVVRAEKTRKDLLKRELTAIDKEKVLGIVLNAAKFEISHYYHKYYKDYYGKT